MPSSRQNMRRLGANEIACTQIEGSAIALALSVKGYIDILSLESAASELENACPALNSRIVYDAKGKLCFERMPEPLKLTVISEVSPDPLKLMQRELSIPFSTSFGPLCRLFAIYALSEIYLVFIAHPAATDAKGLASLAGELIVCSSLGKSSQGYKSSAFGAKEIRKLQSRFSERAKRAVSGLSDRLLATSAKALWSFTSQSESEYSATELSSSWSSGTLGAYETASLLNLAKEQRVPVEHVLAASFLMSSFIAQKKFRSSAVSYECDIRGMLSPETIEKPGTFGYGLSVPFSYSREEPFWENARRLANEAAKARRGMPVSWELLASESLPNDLLEASRVIGIARQPKAPALIATKSTKSQAYYTANVFASAIAPQIGGLAVLPIAMVEKHKSAGIRLSAMFACDRLFYSVQCCFPKEGEETEGLASLIADAFGGYITNDVFYACKNSIKAAPCIVNGLDEEMFLLQG
ncbi:MAG: DUF5308 domain-containing protein [Eubacteriaceae bacterium]|nr:DUF5308 domain-containing protein [Eubacteriaceae bacterium]